MKQMIAILGVALTAAASCTKAPIENLSAEETRVYITQKDASANFSSYTTFAVSDSVILINNGRASLSRTALDAEYVDALRTAFRNRGYTEVARSQGPQLGIQVNRVISTTTGYVSYDDYGGYYDDFYGPGYWGNGWAGGGYGYGWGGVAAYQVSEGIISIDALALTGNGGQVKAVWNGSVRGSGAFDQGYAAQSVNALLDQSPYLRKN